MVYRPLPSPKTGEGEPTAKVRRVVAKNAAPKATPLVRDFIPLAKLPACCASWIADNKAAGVSQARTEFTTGVTNRLVWWMRRDDVSRFDADAVRGFLTYLRTGHELPEGRWGEPGETPADHAKKIGVSVTMRYRAVSPTTIADYHRTLTAFCNWAKSVGFLDVSPVATVKKPIARQGVHNFRVFTKEEMQRIFAAAKKTRFARRDYALCLFLLDTGVRAAELCDLTWADVTIEQKKGRIVNGKGGKSRMVYWSGETARALQIFANEYEILSADDPVFFSQGGHTPGGPLTPNGLRHITEHVGSLAGVDDCTPHAFRHTMATLFILAGGQQFTLMDLLGHSSLVMSKKYVRFSGADLAGQARQYSPVTMVKRGLK